MDVRLLIIWLLRLSWSFKMNCTIILYIILRGLIIVEAASGLFNLYYLLIL